MDNDAGHAKEITLETAHTGSYLCSLDEPAHSSHINDYYSLELSGLTGPKEATILVTYAGLPTNDYVYIALLDSAGGTVNHITSDNNNTAIFQEYVSDGTWYIYVSNQSHSISHSGIGSAPLCYKRPYRIYVMLSR